MNKIAPAQVVFVLLSLIVSATAFASAGTTKMAWDDSSEYLEYHSCGSADACWVVELKDQLTRKLKFKLRCDGEKMILLLPKKAKPQLYKPTCDGFGGQDKMQVITDEVKKIKSKYKL